MPERRSVRLKIPSERLLLLQQSMDDVKKKKRKQRVNWKPGEKEAMVALREQYSNMSLKEFQQTFYPDRSAKNLGMIIKSLKEKQSGKEEEAESGNEDRLRPTTPRLHKLKRPRKNGPFEFSDSEDEDSSPDERIEDINPSGHRTPNKFIKLSHSAEAQSPPNRYEKHRDPRVRSRADEIAQIPKETAALSPKPQTPPPPITTVVQDTGCSELNSSPMCMSPLSSKGPEISLDKSPQIPKETAARLPSPQRTPPQTTIVAQDSGYSEPSSSSTGMSPILDVSQEQPGKCHGSEMQVDVMQDESQQLKAPKQEEELSEHYLRQEVARDSAGMFAGLQSHIRRQDKLISVITQLRAENSILQKKCDMMQQDYELTKEENDKLKVEKEVEIAQLKEQWEAEKESLVQKNARLDKGLEKMRDVMKYLQASPSEADGVRWIPGVGLG